MTFATLKKKFYAALKKPEQKPTSAFMEMGEYKRSQFEFEGDFNVMVDPEGDAWIFMGKHSDIARQLKQDEPEPAAAKS